MEEVARVPDGLGSDDFLAIGALVWKVYSAYADAPGQFHNFSAEILSLHVVVKNVEQQLCTLAELEGDQTGSASHPGSGGKTLRLNSKDTENLKTLFEGLQSIVAQLDALLVKHQRLASNRRISMKEWGKEDLAGLRERIHTTISMLTGFNANLAKCVLPPP